MHRQQRRLGAIRDPELGQQVPDVRLHRLLGDPQLERNPLIGRPSRAGLRELVIGQRLRGYVALYRYVSEIDTVFVLAIRSQKEAGYART